MQKDFLKEVGMCENGQVIYKVDYEPNDARNFLADIGLISHEAAMTARNREILKPDFYFTRAGYLEYLCRSFALGNIHSVRFYVVIEKENIVGWFDISTGDSPEGNVIPEGVNEQNLAHLHSMGFLLPELVKEVFPFIKADLNSENIEYIEFEDTNEPEACSLRKFPVAMTGGSTESVQKELRGDHDAKSSLDDVQMWGYGEIRYFTTA